MESLGIDLKLLIAQAVNFLILLLVLRKFLYRPVLKMLDERREKISQGLEDAQIAENKLKAAEDNANKILEKAEKEARRIREEAKNEAKKAHDKVVFEANSKATKLLEKAKEEASSYKEKALKEAKKELSDVLVLAMDKVIANNLDASQKDILTREAIKQL